MIRNLYTRLVLILIIAALAIWVDVSREIQILNPFNPDAMLFQRNVEPRLGLDLQGGLQVVLEPDMPPGVKVEAADLETARTIIENRTNALGVSENLIQVAGGSRIVGDFPGAEDTEAILGTIRQTGVLEFVDTGDFTPEEGTILMTDLTSGSTDETSPVGTPASATETPDATPSQTETPAEPTPTAEATEPQTVYHTVMTGRELRSVNVGVDQSGKPAIDFTLSSTGTTIFAQHTTANIGKILAITLDRRVISAPRIEGAIPGGQGQITGNFTAESANTLAVQLRYGSLPVPLKEVETRIVGPTLGEDSLQKSLVAGLIGMIIVILFMVIYYRLPGIVAALAILFYAAIAFAIFKYFHFTLTLPGIAGFLLSTGAALDANILIFERLKEELRNGRNLVQAVDQGWTRAWSSIRDSNLATIITSAILYWFGSQFGATIVKGFSLTLALGVAISLFTAIYVTRTLLTIVLRNFKPQNLQAWFGI
ncbi:MAG: protein translocase subunit SecD [Anaerolineales bacterium]|nr:protein translocase subunit SecD [Anaerolineales bacterium]